MPDRNMCTIQRRNGSFCDSPSMPNSPFPICPKHAVELFEHMSSVLQRKVPAMSMYEAGRALALARKEIPQAEPALVYYIQIGEFIKIGTTTNLTRRRRALRVDADAVLATEPGSYGIESRRHEQFAHLRVGRREDFLPDDELLAHIEQLNRGPRAAAG
jgi:hypothetical protein